MKLVEKYIDHICEEVEGAMDYAEKYIEYKAKGESSRASRYRDMASDELGHAAAVRDMAHQDIQRIQAIMPLAIDDEEMWKAAVKRSDEKMAIVKQMIQ